MDIIQYINNIVYEYLTLDNIIEYSSIIVLAIVAWSFWGKPGVRKKISGPSKKHVDKMVEQARKDEKKWTNIQ